MTDDISGYALQMEKIFKIKGFIMMRMTMYSLYMMQSSLWRWGWVLIGGII